MPTTRHWGNKVLAPLTKVTYVIRMGQTKSWSTRSKIKWLIRLQQACRETIELCHEELQKLENYE